MATLETGAPEHLVMLAAWVEAGCSPHWESGAWDVPRLVARGVASWPVGYLPEPERGALAILDLFRTGE